MTQQAYDISALNILVLEKHVLIRKLLTDVFREFGVPSVQSTADPDMAWAFFQQFPADIILSDWCADLNGMEFLRRIRMDVDTPNPFVPVIVVTANTELRHVCTARDMGMTEFLAKPVSARTIYQRICNLIEGNRPFVRANDFFGPDHRRRNGHGNPYDGPNRRRMAGF
ncbi:MAG: response regulator [Rhodospirillaceae bacterium]